MCQNLVSPNAKDCELAQLTCYPKQPSLEGLPDKKNAGMMSAREPQNRKI